jgi:AcrR family transcriptional regulator
MKLGQRTKPVVATDQRILDHARRAFNERGVAAVGIREIARDLGLSPGNVSYHFPTKEALITAMIQEGHARNTAALHPPQPVCDFQDLDAGIRAIMQRDIENRWLQRDYVGLMVNMPALRTLHDQLQDGRDARITTVLADLVGAGLLDGDKIQRRSAELRRQIFTQTFFWLPSAVVSAPDRDPARSLDAAARAVMALFLPYCTASGKRQLEALLDRR